MPRLIDADKVAEAIAWLDEYDFVIWHDVQKCIDKVPTVDAEPVRHGHWEWHEDACDYFCSNCKRFVYNCSLEIVSGEYQYCPHCGAKMDEVEDAKEE